jgi:DNA polymerase III delta prime subunit
MKVTYKDYCNYYAKKCKHCGGQKSVLIDGILQACICQFHASSKWEMSQIKVEPPELKYLTWDDFTGVIKSGGEVVGMLTPQSAQEGKQKALAYCFENGDNSDLRNVSIHRRLGDGANMLIAGHRGTGKSLLAILITKAIILSRYFYDPAISFMWIRSSKLREAARWDERRPINHALLDELTETDFLIIDDVDCDIVSEGGNKGHHTLPPDRTSIDVLFGTRLLYNRPTILVTTEGLVDHLNPRLCQPVMQQWGNEFLNLATASKNTVIRLKRAAVGR